MIALFGMAQFTVPISVVFPSSCADVGLSSSLVASAWLLKSSWLTRVPRAVRRRMGRRRQALQNATMTLGKPFEEAALQKSTSAFAAKGAQKIRYGAG